MEGSTKERQPKYDYIIPCVRPHLCFFVEPPVLPREPSEISHRREHSRVIS
jgi:hypothetical protein